MGGPKGVEMNTMTQQQQQLQQLQQLQPSVQVPQQQPLLFGLAPNQSSTAAGQRERFSNYHLGLEAADAALGELRLPGPGAQNMLGLLNGVEGLPTTAAFNGNQVPPKEKKTRKPRGRTIEQQERRKERNRLLAKKTRLRKKFFQESLRVQILELRAENARLRKIVSDRLDAEKAAALLGTCDALSLTEAVARLPPNAKGVLDTHDRSLLDGIMNAQQCFVLTDPNLPDNPIVYASAGFQRLTQYTSEQVLGRNCRFMQGPDTDPKSVETLREGIKNAVDTSVVMLNYKADGTPFFNQLFVAALRNAEDRVVNFVGVCRGLSLTE